MSWSKRTIVNILLLISIIFLPWWIGAILIIWFYWKYDLLEVIFYALLMDILYASFEATKVIGLPLFWRMGLEIPHYSLPIFTILCGLTMYILSLIKKRIRFNE